MSDTVSRPSLSVPSGALPIRISWGVTTVIAAIHLLALLAVIPWLFSWSGLLLGVAGLYVFSTLGINLCYHRLLTHRSFKTYKWVERVLTLLAFCNMQGSSVHWVAAHRQHHQHSDEEPDPHSPLVDFIWSHIGWMLVENDDIHGEAGKNKYAPDLMKDTFHRRMSQNHLWLGVWIIHTLLFFLVGALIGLATTGSMLSGLQLGLSWVVWGVMVRMVAVWHITWAINSVTHVWGYRNYETTDNSRNNWLFGLLAMGEGWHNNHHADQRSAAHGHRWWEVDVTYLSIVLMRCFGLAWDIVKPQRNEGTKHDLAHKKV